MESYWGLIERIVRESDLVLEILDARMIELSRNEGIEKLVEEIGRPILFVVNKSDLVNKNNLKRQVKELKKIGDVVFVSAKKPSDVKVLIYAIKKTFKIYGKRAPTTRKVGDPKIKTREAKGEIVVGILGYPNVGKSSIINALAHKKKAKVSKRAGTTHGIHWIKINNEIKVIDSPGVIPLRTDDEIRYVLIGARTDKIKDVESAAYAFVKLFFEKNPDSFNKLYDISINDNVEEVIEQVGRRRNYLTKGGLIDENKVCSKIVKDWQDGKLAL